jgi:membrane-associated phospholipid phosphatase
MDIEYLLLLQNLREASGGVLNGFFLAVTHLGGATAMILVMAAVYWCIDKSVGEYLLFNALIGKVLNEVIKITACVPRPWLRDSRVTPLAAAIDGATGYSFPSGHTTIAAAMWGGLAVKYRKRRALAVLFVVLWVLVAFSRNYVGVHTPQDVVVASLLGIGLLWLSLRLESWLVHHPERDLAVTGVILAAGFVLMLYAACKSYPVFEVNGVVAADPAQLRLDAFSTAGAAVGFGVGWLLERRVVGFSVEGSVLRRVVRFVVGIATVLVLYQTLGTVCELVLPAASAAALSMGILVFYLVAVYPWLFTKVERRGRAGMR